MKKIEKDNLTDNFLYFLLDDEEERNIIAKISESNDLEVVIRSLINLEEVEAHND